MFAGHVELEESGRHVPHAAALLLTSGVLLGVLKVVVLPMPQDVDPLLPALFDQVLAVLVGAVVDDLAEPLLVVRRGLVVLSDPEVLVAFGVGRQAGAGHPVADQPGHSARTKGKK